MKTDDKFTYGIVLNIVGSLLFIIGLAISFTLVGACLGIPMIIVGLPLLIWGAIWIFKAKNDRQRQAISKGIQDGLAQQQLAKHSPDLKA